MAPSKLTNKPAVRFFLAILAIKPKERPWVLESNNKELTYILGFFLDQVISMQTQKPLRSDVTQTRLKDLVEMRYGYRDGKIYTLKEIGQSFGVTQERVRQIEARMLRMMRRWVFIELGKAMRFAQAKMNHQLKQEA